MLDSINLVEAPAFLELVFVYSLVAQDLGEPAQGHAPAGVGRENQMPDGRAFLEPGMRFVRPETIEHGVQNF